MEDELASDVVCNTAWHSSAGVQDYVWGWRFSLGFACVFAALFFLGTLISPDSPNSLLLNGKTEKATQVSPAMHRHHRISLLCLQWAVCA